MNDNISLDRNELILIHDVFAETRWRPDQALQCQIAASVILKVKAILQVEKNEGSKGQEDGEPEA